MLSPPSSPRSLPREASGPTPESDPWRIEPLAGWHLALLGDPAFLPLHAVLQQAVLWGVPERLLRLITNRQSLAPQVLVAFAPHSQTVLGLVVSRRLNRSGTCWQMQHLRTTRADLRSSLSAALLREAIQRAQGATSWVASASSLDLGRMAMLREQGFQPLRNDHLWFWQSGCIQQDKQPSDLQLRPLNRRTAPQLWHLEQAACPAQLRQILDRRVEDLLDQSQSKGWMLLDPSRQEAVAAVRWLGDHAGGGHEIELTVHPGWGHLYGAPTTWLLEQIGRSLDAGAALWLRSDGRDAERQRWLHNLGAEERGERVLMARSLWRRAPLVPQNTAGRRIEAVLEQLQPRRRPAPSPLQRP